MPVFSYVAKDGEGRSIKAQESAVSEQELKIKLARKNLTIISISDKTKVTKIRFSGKKIKTGDLVIFCKQLATMIKGGVPLLKAINSIAEEVKNPTLKVALDEISLKVKGGESLSSGFKNSPIYFPISSYRWSRRERRSALSMSCSSV
jgi:Type II secretory pathway, component PulF